MPKKPELVPSEILPMYHYKAAFNFIFVQIQCFTDYFSPLNELFICNTLKSYLVLGISSPLSAILVQQNRHINMPFKLKKQWNKWNPGHQKYIQAGIFFLN